VDYSLARQGHHTLARARREKGRYWVFLLSWVQLWERMRDGGVCEWLYFLTVGNPCFFFLLSMTLLRSLDPDILMLVHFSTSSNQVCVFLHRCFHGSGSSFYSSSILVLYYSWFRPDPVYSSRSCPQSTQSTVCTLALYFLPVCFSIDALCTPCKETIGFCCYDAHELRGWVNVEDNPSDG